MAINTALYASRADEWPPPRTFFATLNDEFQFTLDPCATRENATCARYFTMKERGLAKDWGHRRVFCNPPYARAISAWVQKCYLAAMQGATVVLLIPSRTDTRCFHDWIYGKAELRFVRGRLKFGDGSQSAPFPSLVAIYRPARAR